MYTPKDLFKRQTLFQFNVDDFFSVLETFQRILESLNSAKQAVGTTILYQPNVKSRALNVPDEYASTIDAPSVSSGRVSPLSQTTSTVVPDHQEMQSANILNQLENKKRACLQAWQHCVDLVTQIFQEREHTVSLVGLMNAPSYSIIHSMLSEQEEFNLAYNALKLEADILLEFKDFRNALMKYKKLKGFCEDKRRFREKTICYG